MLKKRKSGGSLSLVIRVSPTGVRFLSLAIISAGGRPMSGMLSASSLLVVHVELPLVRACALQELAYSALWVGIGLLVSLHS